MDHLLAFSIDPSLSGYDGDRPTALFQRMQEELAAVPGVRGVSMSEIGALTGNDWSMTVRVDGYQAKEGEDMNPSVDGVGPRYFETMGIPLVAGREFTEHDVKGAPRVAIINETMAKYFFNGVNADRPPSRLRARQRHRYRDRRRREGRRSLELRDRAPRFIYMPYAQDESVTQLTFYVRARRAAAPPARRSGRRCSASIRTCRSST